MDQLSIGGVGSVIGLAPEGELYPNALPPGLANGDAPKAVFRTIGPELQAKELVAQAVAVIYVQEEARRSRTFSVLPRQRPGANRRYGTL